MANVRCHGIVAIDTASLGLVTVLFGLVMITASLRPALRAARLDPVEILRDS